MLPGTWTCFCHVCARKMMISVYFLVSSSFLVRFFPLSTMKKKQKIFLLHFFFAKCKNVDAMTFFLQLLLLHFTKNEKKILESTRAVEEIVEDAFYCGWLIRTLTVSTLLPFKFMIIATMKKKSSAAVIINAKPVSHKNV